MHTGLEFMPQEVAVTQPQDVVEIRFYNGRGVTHSRIPNMTPKGAYEWAVRGGFTPTPWWKSLFQHPSIVEVWTRTENNYAKWEFKSDTSYERVG